MENIKIEFLSQVADLKEIDYKNTLAIVSLIELLIDKGIITKDDLFKKSHQLDQE